MVSHTGCDRDLQHCADELHQIVQLPCCTGPHQLETNHSASGRCDQQVLIHGRQRRGSVIVESCMYPVRPLKAR